NKTFVREQPSSRKMTTPSPTHSDSSDSSKHESNRVRRHVGILKRLKNKSEKKRSFSYSLLFVHLILCFSCVSFQDSWEIVEGLRGVPASMQEPDRQEGFLLKRRKWPMKGWHKRYFVLVKGIMTYGKRGTDIQKGKIHGCIDVGLSVMSIKKKAMCIDLDTEDNIYHLKVKSSELFEEWVSKLRHHRLFRQNEIAVYPHERHLFHPHASSSPTFNDSYRRVNVDAGKQSIALLCQLFLSLCGSACWDVLFHGVFSWCYYSELEECESYLLELNLLLKSMEVMHRTYSAPAITSLQASAYDNPKKEKRPKRWRSKNNGKDTKATLQVFFLYYLVTYSYICISSQSPRLHASNPNLSTTSSQEICSESPDSPTDVSRLQEDFCRLANNIHTTLKSAHSSLTAERDRLKHTIDLQGPQPAQVGQPLSTIRHCVFDQESPGTPQSLVHQISNESKTSIPESISEFFDAQEYLLSSSSSENEVSDDDSYLSDVSDSVSMDTFDGRISSVVTVARRRSTLPSTCPSSSVSLWNILRNNIGKDLSKVAMPVQLNEPLNTLQRLCEELEYSNLLDIANQTHDPYQRMVFVATFAISAYTSTYCRAGSKPFNPVLGETYECDRPEKGFRFIAEQVSHHPPVSACHADSKNFKFWQDVRWKNKFWGKSMEIVPIGTTHVTLPAFGDHYEWNKVTSCIHNILSGQRWIEHYGEMSIKNVNSDVCQCKITFIKAKSWSSTVNEIKGVVTNAEGKAVHSIFGKWHESVFQGDPPSATCIWRPMPKDQEQYYGFTQFAVELNELDSNLRPLLPPTDTRFRPDQRLLEEGNIDGAEEQKQRIEQLQRERRKVLQDNNMTHQPRFFKKSKDDTWISNNTYWELRRDSGFSKMDFSVLW
uniref:Oxysterol-binding protein n=1 Tax=Oryzias sinensis TaxID=183150 RepID=A0A8C7XTW0_9TELE